MKFYCPNCGKKMEDVLEMDVPPVEPKIFDCYCKECEWTGEISPDKEIE